MPPLDFVGLLEEIKRSYESMEDPNYSFVDKAMSSRPYARVVGRLEESFDVEEITDPRDDVSFVYLLGKEGVRWERGERHPAGASPKLLTLVREKGLDAVA